MGKIYREYILYLKYRLIIIFPFNSWIVLRLIVFGFYMLDFRGNNKKILRYDWILKNKLNTLVINFINIKIN